MTQCYGNPSSLHAMGFAAEKEMAAARAAVAERLSAQPNEIYFTSGGTESDNIAILGAAHAKKARRQPDCDDGDRAPAVLRTMEALEREGFEVVYVEPEGDGNIPAEKFAAAIDAKTVLVSVMAVQQRDRRGAAAAEIAVIIRRKKAPALFPHRRGAGVLQAAAFDEAARAGSRDRFGPRGARAEGRWARLAVRGGVHILPHSFGGGQERTAPRHRGRAANLRVQRGGA